jgi:hypothetical protein
MAFKVIRSAANGWAGQNSVVWFYVTGYYTS